MRCSESVRLLNFHCDSISLFSPWCIFAKSFLGLVVCFSSLLNHFFFLHFLFLFFLFPFLLLFLNFLYSSLPQLASSRSSLLLSSWKLKCHFLSGQKARNKFVLPDKLSGVCIHSNAWISSDFRQMSLGGYPWQDRFECQPDIIGGRNKI